MIAKVINVFYDTNCYPFKDKTLQTRFPIVGNSFAGASNVTDIKFYVDNIGGDQLTWVAKSHLPNGKVGSQILSTSTDSQGFYAILHLTNFYTQAKGDLYISLEGYNAGDTELVYDDETELYSVSGNPVIQGTGNIKLSVLYTTPIEMVEDIEGIDSDSVLGYLSTKLDKNSRKYIKFVDDVSDINDDEYSQYLLSGDTIFTYNQHEFYELSTENDELVATPIELGYVRKKPTQRNTVYGVNDSGVDTNYPLNLLAMANTIPIRDSGGQLEVALTPTRNASATSKQYVDRFGHSFVASIDSSTYVMTLALKDKNGNTLSTQTIDLPLETMVVSGYYDDYNEKIVLTLKNGETIDIPVDDLVYGLASETYVNNAINTALTLYYTKSDVDTLLGNKENVSNKVTSLSNANDTTYPTTKAVKDYVDDIDLTDYYTKDETDALLDNIKKSAFTIVNTTTYPTLQDFLATTGEEGYIYLYPIDTTDLTQGYYQYIWENNSWLALGTTKIDLTYYYTKTQVDTELAKKQDALGLSIDNEGYIVQTIDD